MSRAKVLAIVSAGAVGFAMAACGTKYNHPGGIAECSPDLPCHIGSPGGVTSGNPADAGGDTGALDGGVNSISLPACEAHATTTFTHAPKNDPLDTVDPLATLAPTGGVAHQGTVTGGMFALPSVDAQPNEYGWFELFNPSVPTFDTRTIGHVLHDTTTAQTIPGPLYFPIYTADLRTSLGATVGVTKALAGTATIVVQLVDAAGAPVVGATGSMTGASTDCNATTPPPVCGPYYDNGAGGLVMSPGGTGSEGTIVFLGVDGAGPTRTAPNFSVVTVTKSGGTATPLPKMATIQNAYSYVRHTLK